MRFKILFSLMSFIGLLSFAEKAQIKVNDINTDQDTSIVIKKGPQAGLKTCVEYQILDGKDEINGTPEFDKGKALAHWTDACKEWKASIKELNQGNQILLLNCNRATADKEGDTYTYHSLGTYKFKVKVKE